SQLASLSLYDALPIFTYLAVERLERKTSDVNRLLNRFNNSWDDVFYIMLSRNFGFGINSDEFERLALSLPLNIIQKHGDSLFQRSEEHTSELQSRERL